MNKEQRGRMEQYYHTEEAPLRLLLVVLIQLLAKHESHLGPLLENTED